MLLNIILLIYTTECKVFYVGRMHLSYICPTSLYKVNAYIDYKLCERNIQQNRYLIIKRLRCVERTKQIAVIERAQLELSHPQTQQVFLKLFRPLTLGTSLKIGHAWHNKVVGNLLNRTIKAYGLLH